MSWSARVPETPAADFVKAVEDLELPVYNGSTSNYPAETVEQFHAVKRAAIAIFESGAVGPVDSGYYSASLSGHSNPAHAKTPGWADDMVGCYVNQAREPQKPQV